MKRKIPIIYVLPNLFTISSLTLGIYAIISASTGSVQGLINSAIAICFSILFDSMDGRVARLTKTESLFGMQLDSLADLVAFGVAPAFLLYKWGLYELGILGVAAAAMFATCGALRLARFNVISLKNSKQSSEYFVGLPIPGAAGIVVSLFLTMNHSFATNELVKLNTPVNMLILTAIISYLMVSNIRYPTFKHVRPTPKNFSVTVLILIATIYVSVVINLPLALFSLIGIYTLLGPIMEVMLYKKRKEEAIKEEY
ncbi:MAG: CDP-diacylglycerol--serine O-phosphatidyltransferase [Deltaproteobacteria bacterium]|nr:CDP-diacylglycerol--serine O-phosphatidyltransferase [Deltaproteobacteria bacterium]